MINQVKICIRLFSLMQNLHITPDITLELFECYTSLINCPFSFDVGDDGQIRVENLYGDTEAYTALPRHEYRQF